MSPFKHLNPDGPATLESVVEAVICLSAEYDETQLAQLVAEGKIRQLFPFQPKNHDFSPDFVAEEDLVEASPAPLTRQQRSALIKSSMPQSTETTASRIPGFARRKAASSDD